MTTSKSKAKGSAFERLVANYVGGKRTYSSGQHKDVGDVHLNFDRLPDRDHPLPYSYKVVFECKDVAQQNWSEWLKECAAERENARARYGFVVWKRRQRPVSESYVVMTLKQLMELLG